MRSFRHKIERSECSGERYGSDGNEVSSAYCRRLADKYNVPLAWQNRWAKDCGAYA